MEIVYNNLLAIFCGKRSEFLEVSCVHFLSSVFAERLYYLGLYVTKNFQVLWFDEDIPFRTDCYNLSFSEHFSVVGLYLLPSTAWRSFFDGG